ncbi:hypothetical protein GH714_027076 [Hevea brasiliensis]|uniref:Uncharacterized protein n=1 Tax=Hevea brasiliensis TaxID=3981 RepID=A0A6A6MLA7_HEVBR|nr:hypothetical protein GH714_027076 [Hevea brasiliensis]
MSSLGLRSDGFRALDCAEWFGNVAKSLDSEHLTYFCVMLWLIWRDRNQLAFKRPSRPIPEICQGAQGLVEEFRSPAILRSSGPLPLVSSWGPPAAGFVKINSDPSISARLGCTTVGAFCPDRKDQLDSHLQELVGSVIKVVIMTFVELSSIE